MYKRFLASLLTLCMLLTLLPAAAMAAEVSGEEIPGKLLSIGEDEWGEITFETFEDLKKLASRSYDEHTNANYYGSGPLVIEEDLTIPENLAILIDEQLTIPEGVTFSFPDGEYSGTLWAGSMLVEGTANCSMLDISNSLTVTGLLSTSGAIHISYDATLTGAENIVYENDWAKLYWQCGIYDTATLIDVANSANSAQNDPNWFYRINLGFEDILIDESINLPANCQIDAYGRNGVYTTTIAEGCTLDLDCDYTLIRLPFVVNGTICNNSGITIKSGDEYDNGSITFSEGSTYTGAGEIFIYSDELTDPQDAVPGLDLSQFDIVEAVEDWGEHYWKLTPKGQSHTHSYTSKTTAPTCTEKGYTTYTCACGDTYTADEVAALGHKYENGTCTVCGEPDPSYNEAVTRLSGSNRYDTAFCTADALKDALGVQTFDNIVVAYGRNFADALAGSYLATELDAPILLTEDSAHRNVTNYIKENLSANGKVYILGGENSISASFSDGLSAAGISWERLSGSNRYLTNLEILAEAGLNGRTILVCDGNNFADSLSASAANLPILLVGSNLSPDQKDYLSKLTGCSFRIIGGPNSVSESIAEALKAYGTVDRISGSTREETSAKVAEIFCPDPDTVTLAYSRNFPDGLCGGPLAYQLGAPLLLVNSGAESFAADYVADNEITSGIILGGTSSIPDDVANAVFPQ